MTLAKGVPRHLFKLGCDFFPMRYVLTQCHKIILTRIHLVLKRKKPRRRLEIGSGRNRLLGFETLDITWARNIDYVLDASKPLPFRDGTFEIVYASHVLEHIPWYKVEDTLREWTRIIKPSGRLEIWVPDGLKICKLVIDAESGLTKIIPDDWCVRNPDKDPYLWAAGRLFWGANPSYPSWHRGLFTPRYLKLLFEKIGLTDISQLNPQDVRGYDHGWINLGMRGTKP